MKRYFAIFLTAGLLSASVLPASAQLPAYTVHIVITNATQSNGAWMTAYMNDAGDKIVGSWCVGPRETIDRTFGKGRGPYKVIAEITPQANCHGGQIKRLAQDTGWNYRTTEYYFHKTIRGRDRGAEW